MFRPIKNLMHTTHETQAANRNEPDAYLKACARKGYEYLNKHHKDKKKSRAHLDQYLATCNGDGVLIYIRGLAQQDIDKIDQTPDMLFEKKLDLQEKPRQIQALVMEAFQRKQASEAEAATARPSHK